MKTTTPPTGIIRTLPSLYADPSNPGHHSYQATLAAMKEDPDRLMAIALAQQPKHELLHLYILIGGEIKARFNLVGYEPGDARECWDTSIRQPKVWAICCGRSAAHAATTTLRPAGGSIARKSNPWNPSNHDHEKSRQTAGREGHAEAPHGACGPREFDP